LENSLGNCAGESKWPLNDYQDRETLLSNGQDKIVSKNAGLENIKRL